MDCSSPERPPAPRWIKAWVPQPLVASGGKCSLLKWIREDTLKALKEKDLEPEETKPESTTEVLFLCSYEGCGQTFIDAAALRKHAHIHGERKLAHNHGERQRAQNNGGRKLAHNDGERQHAHNHGDRKLAYNHGDRKLAHNHGERQHVHNHGDRKLAYNHGERQHVHNHGDRKLAYNHGERQHVHNHGDRKLAYNHGERQHVHNHGDRKLGDRKLAYNHGERQHVHNHGERQHVCDYEGCGKRFTDSSKLKRHFLTHTGERDFKCSFEGCGKAFALVFNLRTHMKTHYPENYHVCSYPECGKRFTHESKLKSHIKAAHQQKNMAVKDTPMANRPNYAPKSHSAANHRSASVARPYACPHEGCSKAYIHEYKLNLHLRNTHGGNGSKSSLATTNHAVAQAIDRDAHRANLKRSYPVTSRMMPPPKLPNRMGSSFNAVNKQWPADDDSNGYYENAEEGRWRYPVGNEDNRMGSSFNAVNKQWPADDDSNGYYENAEVGRWRYPVGNEDDDDDEGTEDEG